MSGGISPEDDFRKWKEMAQDSREIFNKQLDILADELWLKNARLFTRPANSSMQGQHRSALAKRLQRVQARQANTSTFDNPLLGGPYANATWRPETPADARYSHAAAPSAMDDPHDPAIAARGLLLESLKGIAEECAPPPLAVQTRIASSLPLVSCQQASSTDNSPSAASPHQPRAMVLPAIPHHRMSPVRTAAVINRHDWGGGRDQTIEAVSIMHSPGHLRGYSRALKGRSPPHGRYVATAYHKVSHMYPGGENPESDVYAANFMKGMGPFVHTGSPLRRLPPRVRSLPRLCTSYGYPRAAGSHDDETLPASCTSDKTDTMGPEQTTAPGGDVDHGDGDDGQQTNEADVDPVHGNRDGR